MTIIKFEKYKVEIEGHAGYGPAGQDIVCAAISMLTYTLIESLHKEGIHFCEETMPGHAMIEAWPTEEQAEKVKIIFDVIKNGIQLLHEEFADHVQLT